jgi:TIR domain
MPRVFVSYRRSDADTDAGRIADRLVDAFGRGNVFHDHETLKAGIRWEQQIEEALSRTDVVIVVIGPAWLTEVRPDGRRRLDDPDDMVAYEIARSIDRGIRIVPVLVKDATLPTEVELPERLKALPKYQARKVRNDSFVADVDRLVEDLSGRRRNVRLSWAMASAAALAAVAGVGAWWFSRPGAPPPDVGQEEASGTLGLRIRVRGEQAATSSDAIRFLLYVIEPVRISKAELSAPKTVSQGVLEIAERGTLLPRRGERYEADIHRQPLSATLERRASHGRSTVCLVRSERAPPSNLTALVECDEGERCMSAPDNPGHFEVCGSRANAGDTPSWTWTATAHAQGLANEAWVVPSIETLRRQRDAGTGPAFTEVTLSSSPLPALAAAKMVSVEVTVNGRTALIDGLPPDASAVRFDAVTGLRLSFGLENLDFAGANKGHEAIDVKLRFLDASGKTLVRETQARLDYISLRNQPESRPAGKDELGIRWTARYYSGLKDDRFQIFLTSSPDIDALVRAKRDFDGASHAADVDGRSHPLVAVIRPPFGDNRNWGLNVGLLLPSGQIRFTFDDATSTRLCRSLAQLARAAGSHVREDSYRRSVDGTRQIRQCAAFGQG